VSALSVGVNLGSNIFFLSKTSIVDQWRQRC
jgi:hypothetical protein